MHKKLLFILLILLIFTGYYTQVKKGKKTTQEEDFPGLSEYCFSLDEYELGIDKQDTTPADFFAQGADLGLQAAINGVYYGADDDLSQGDVMLNGEQVSSLKGLVSGYLNITESEVYVSEERTDATTFIGTHPLLLQNGLVHKQAMQERYNNQFAPRSAIGTKDKKGVCFAVANSMESMLSWAEKLQAAGYIDAINLDGGAVSQLVTRDGVFGVGLENTKMIISARDK